MFHYRLYFMSARTGHIDRFAEFEAPDDESALGLAWEQEGKRALELWSGHRKVGRLEAADPARAIVARWQAALERRLRSLRLET